MEDRIVAHNLIELRQKIIGRRSCKIYITHSLARVINKMPKYEGSGLWIDLKIRDIELVLER